MIPDKELNDDSKVVDRDENKETEGAEAPPEADDSCATSWKNIDEFPALEHLNDLPELTPEERKAARRAGMNILNEFKGKLADKKKSL